VGHHLEIKVCGLSTVETARAAVRAGADWLGLVLAPSPRRVYPDDARELVGEVEARWVGVFMDEEPGVIARLARELGLTAVQLHGAESPAACRAVRAEAGVPVWKGVRWSGDPQSIELWSEAADVVLFDSGSGSGRPLPWSEIRIPPPGARPARAFLAGGLAADNVAWAIATLRPDGVDASSRLERAPGDKDVSRIEAYVAAARAAELPDPAEPR
jgi:phosphoribosylanthranilate isomerase